MIKGSVCSVCPTVEPRHRCSKCHIARYCSAACSKLDWTVHKQECENMNTYDAKKGCRDLLEHIQNTEETRLEIGKAAFLRGHTFALAIRIKNAYELRMAMRADVICFPFRWLANDKLIKGVPPLSETGVRPNIDFVVYLEVLRPGATDKYHAMAVAMPFLADKDIVWE